MPKYHTKPRSLLSQSKPQVFTQLQDDADHINSQQSSWVAGVYPEFQDVPLQDVHRMRGGHRSVVPPRPQHKVRKLLGASKQGQLSQLPSSWDWRDVGGVNYVSDVRNQGKCGSCYAFSSMGMLEARVKIMTNNTKNYVFSTQDIVSCSLLSQGCEGGFPYLVAGRYAKDYGVVEEDCAPYVGQDGSCSTKHCTR